MIIRATPEPVKGAQHDAWQFFNMSKTPGSEQIQDKHSLCTEGLNRDSVYYYTISVY